MIFYLPVILAGNVAALMSWRLMLDPSKGLVNTILSWMSDNIPLFGWVLRAIIYVTEISNALFIGLQRGNMQILTNVINSGFPQDGRMPLWYTNEIWTKPSIVIILIWSAGSMMLVYLAALKGVPRRIYEAAQIDGANKWQQFRHITLPMITPATFYNLVVGIIASLQIFEQAYIVAPTAGPSESSFFAAYYLYRATFRYNDQIGYGAAMSWILLVITLCLTLAQFIMSKRWVHYDVD